MCEAAVEEPGLGGQRVCAVDGKGGRPRRRNHREVRAVELGVYRAQITGELVQRRQTATCRRRRL